VPRAKPPELPTIVRDVEFRFSRDQRRNLTKLLPSKLAELTRPVFPASPLSVAPEAKTVVDHVIQSTEMVISAYLTAEPWISEARITLSNVRAAIRRVRQALRLLKSVDDETHDIVPADLDAKLAERERKLARLRVAPARQRALVRLCQDIRMFVAGLSEAHGETISKQAMLRYVDAALNFASIKHPDFSKYRDRFTALVFPKN
jgi:hypothetical protein